MKCTDAKHLIHLDVGNDLRAEEESQLASHMELCGDCRSYHGGMSSAMSALLMLRNEPSMIGGNPAGTSVWPALSREIKRRKLSPRIVRKFNLQVVALSVCSLSLAVVTMVQSLSSMRDDYSSTGFMPAQSISNSHWTQQPQYPGPQFQSGFVGPNGDPRNDRLPMLPHDVPATPPQSF